jgi:CheY-like chemotaxis protein
MLAKEIRKRQRYDWRDRADLPINDPQVRRAVRDLSGKIASALSRTELLAPIAGDERGQNLELARVSEMIKREEPPKGAKKAAKRVLWVDDRPDNNKYERTAMEAYNIEFDLAGSTGEALSKISKNKFDAIISDMGRPPDPRAGYTFLDVLRASGNLVPFFIYAGSDDPRHRQEALSRGAQGSTNNPTVLIAEVLKSLDLRQ